MPKSRRGVAWLLIGLLLILYLQQTAPASQSLLPTDEAILEAVGQYKLVLAGLAVLALITGFVAAYAPPRKT